MLKLAIVSRDYSLYKHYFETITPRLNKIALVFAGPSATNIVMEQAEIILSEPDTASTFINECKKLKWMQSTWAGNNKLQQLAKRNYTLTSTKGIFAEQMREYVFAYLLYFQRQITQLQRLQASQTWQSLKIGTLAGKRLGIMGLGNIGCELAVTAESFGMHVSAITAQTRPMINIDYYSLSDVLKFANNRDFIVNLLPETDATKGVCNSAFFAAMKPSGIFLNAGRGSILESDFVVVDALKSNTIQAAVLDVFTEEPLSAEHPFYTLENCYITNHTAAISDPRKVFSVFVQNLQRFISSQPLHYQHDFLKGY